MYHHHHIVDITIISEDCQDHSVTLQVTKTYLHTYKLSKVKDTYIHTPLKLEFSSIDILKYLQFFVGFIFIDNLNSFLSIPNLVLFP